MHINLLRNLLVCPACRSNLSTHANGLNCNHCLAVYQFVDGKVIFTTTPAKNEHNSLDQLKSKIKKFPTIYKFLSEVVAPVYVSKKRLKIFISEIDKNNLVGLNLGSGITNYSQKIINFDLQDFKNVEVIGDLFQLPFRDCTFDYIFNLYVLEHVPDPKLAVEEIHRVLKPGGIGYFLIPFIQGFHAAPNDYFRFTSKGVESYFQGFDIIKNRGLGPTSAMLWILQEWLAIVLSFNSQKLHLVMHTLIVCISFPLKYLDVILSKFFSVNNIASVNEVIARKSL